MWQIWIDRGGTFTDIVARQPDGTLRQHKLLSENPARYDDAVVQGIRDVMGLAPGEPLPANQIEHIKMGTTVATNALLERKGDRTVFVTTSGFADALRIGYQNRPDLFALAIELPTMLYERVIEVNERVSIDGDVLQAPRLERLREQLQSAYNDGIRSVAIALLHGYRYSNHEQRIGDLCRDIGFTQISLSHEISPLIKLIARGDTTVVDAYLSPILRRYIDRVASELGSDSDGPRIFFMQSNGGLTDAEHFCGKDAILSGPAGGVVGMVQTGVQAGFGQLIGFDMGGTSTDVTHFSGQYERSFETVVGGVRMRVPMMHIHTVAAGGGSTLQFDGSRFRVGPESAGADPGPACYRGGGPLTVTDCNVLLGKLQPDYFPAIFGTDGNLPLDRDLVEQRFASLADEIGMSTGKPATPETVAEGFLRIAVENMANAIKKISLQRGYDVTEYALSSFGGAGGQHACLVADALGMRRILLHPLAGVLSAYGMGLADIRALREAQCGVSLGDTELESKLASLIEPLENNAIEELRVQGIAHNAVSIVKTVHVRYAGTDTALPILLDDAVTIQANFEAAHRKRFGFIDTERALEIDAVSIEAIGKTGTTDEHSLHAGNDAGSSTPLAVVRMYCGGAWQDTPVYKRTALPPAQQVTGPAIITDTTGTTVIEPGWQATKDESQALILERYVARSNTEAIGTDADPVMLEVFNNLFMSIAEQMGATLQNTAYSVNIKERLDFSCALFSADGALVANAPHLPVHLGSMSESVRSIVNDNNGEIRPGDVFALNAPYNGGTHLPDVTVVTPVFNETGEAIRFFVASRGHHADIGGRTPGSSPPDSRHIDEEGIVIDNFRLVTNGSLRDKETRALLSSGPCPCRNIDQNMADLKAQIAANETGVRELQRMIEHFGEQVVRAYMQHVQDNAEEAVRRVIDNLHDGAFDYPMDDGSHIRVAIKIDHASRSAAVDFSGTSQQHAGNYNAPVAISKAAVLYVLRTLVGDQIPLNEGCLRPIDLILPKASMVNPRIPGRCNRGQYRSVTSDYQRLVRRTRCARRLTGNDEQPDLRRQRVSELRNHLRWHRCRSRFRRYRCRP